MLLKNYVNNKPKYKVVSIYGRKKYFYNKKSLLEDLDITDEELRKHLNGFITILDEIGVFIQKI